MKYKKPLIIIAILYAILIPFVLSSIITTSSSESDMTALLPGGVNLDLALMFMVIIPLGAIIGSVLGYFLAPLFLLVHKKTLGRSLSYSIQERTPAEKFKHLFRGFFPGLMAINFGLMLSSNSLIADLILAPEQDSTGAALNIIVMIFLLGWTLAAAFALFSSVWILMEAGIVYSNQEKVKDSDYPFELHAVGGWYSYILKGYAGISVILTLYQLSSELILEAGETGNIALVLTLIFFPLLISILVLPAVVLFDVLKTHRSTYMKKMAGKMGVIEYTELEIRVIKK